MHATFSMKTHSFCLDIAQALAGKTLATWQLWNTTTGTCMGSGVVSARGCLVGSVRPVRARSLRATSSEVWGAACRAYQGLAGVASASAMTLRTAAMPPVA